MKRTNPFTLEFTLKQHTPIIHFQHDQDGATLRATEVKPKLDAFLLKYLGDTVDPSWIVKDSQGNKSLKYKLTIHMLKESTNTVEVPYGALFGDPLNDKVAQYGDSILYPTPFFANNISDKGKERKSIFNKDKITINIVSLYEALLEKIEAVIQHFFVLHNFGTRQSKGFGCYYLENTDETKYKASLFWLERNGNISSSFVLNTSMENYRSGLKEIDRFHGYLKRGYNHNDYIKSAIMCFFYGQNIAWEKKAIKVELKTTYTDVFDKLERKFTPMRIEGERLEEQMFIRALLGLPDHYEFKTTMGGMLKVYVKCLTNPRLSRFKSPITYKFFNGKIYLLANYIDSYLYQFTSREPDELLPQVYQFYVKKSDAITTQLFTFPNDEQELALLDISVPFVNDLKDLLLFFIQYIEDENLFNYTVKQITND